MYIHINLHKNATLLLFTVENTIYLMKILETETKKIVLAFFFSISIDKFQKKLKSFQIVIITLEISRKYPLRGYILGVLMDTTA